MKLVMFLQEHNRSDWYQMFLQEHYPNRSAPATRNP
jgi:hypothetical protein